MEFSFSVFSLMLSKLPALSSLNPNMTFWEWCANMTWTKYFFFIKSIFHVHSRTWVIIWRFHILLFFDGESFLLYLRCISSSSSATPPLFFDGESFQREVEKAYSTWYSQAVSHPSTNQAGPCLGHTNLPRSDEIGRIQVGMAVSECFHPRYLIYTCQYIRGSVQ